jgi:hypothetical protein
MLTYGISSLSMLTYVFLYLSCWRMEFLYFPCWCMEFLLHALFCVVIMESKKLHASAWTATSYVLRNSIRQHGHKIRHVKEMPYVSMDTKWCMLKEFHTFLHALFCVHADVWNFWNMPYFLSILTYGISLTYIILYPCWHMEFL